jgi:hypothetical protein
MADRLEQAEEEYTSFDFENVRVERRRMWIGHPYHKYVVREVVVHDTGRQRRVEPSGQEWVRPRNESREIPWGTTGDLAFEFLKANGKHGIVELARKMGLPRTTVEYGCKTHPGIVKMERGVWSTI